MSMSEAAWVYSVGVVCGAAAGYLLTSLGMQKSVEKIIGEVEYGLLTVQKHMNLAQGPILPESVTFSIAKDGRVHVAYEHGEWLEQEDDDE